VKTALPEPLRSRQAPFPFTSIFQNGPRRQGCAPENLFKPGKDSPPPRKKRAPLPAPGRSEDLPMRRERGQTQRPKPSQLAAAYRLPMVGPEAFPSVLFRSRKLKIRARPVDDVNNLRHHGKCQRCFASTAIQIRRNALFTSPEYASGREVDKTPGQLSNKDRTAEGRGLALHIRDGVSSCRLATGLRQNVAPAHGLIPRSQSRFDSSNSLICGRSGFDGPARRPA
jgi:hypothetical protein